MINKSSKNSILTDGADIGGYKVIKLLGVGGMGEVYLVENIHIHKKYALKVLFPGFAKRKGFIERFKVEARVMADLKHPNIVQVHNTGYDKKQNLYFLVMEYVDSVISSELSVASEESGQGATVDYGLETVDLQTTNNHQLVTNPSSNHELRITNEEGTVEPRPEAEESGQGTVDHRLKKGRDGCVPWQSFEKTGPLLSAGGTYDNASGGLGADTPYPSDLEQLLKQKKKLDEDYVLKITKQLCSALDYAHNFDGNSILHCDLKPSNILIDSLGNIKITDFGLAKISGSQLSDDSLSNAMTVAVQNTLDNSIGMLKTIPVDIINEKNECRLYAETDSEDFEEKTISDQLFGTYEYMAPELIKGAKNTIQSDIYSLGIIIYRMLTGLEVKGHWDLPSELGLSTIWDDIVIKCLKSDPKERYSSVSSIIEALEKIESSSTVKRTGSIFTISFKKIRGFLLLILGLLLTAYIAYFAFTKMNDNSEEGAITSKLKIENSFNKIESLNKKINYSSGDINIFATKLFQDFIHLKKKGDYLFKRQKFDQADDAYKNAEKLTQTIINKINNYRDLIKVKHNLVKLENECLHKLPSNNGGEFWNSYINEKNAALAFEKKMEYKKSIDAYLKANSALKEYNRQYAAYINIKNNTYRMYNDLIKKYKDEFSNNLKDAEVNAAEFVKDFDYIQAFSVFNKTRGKLLPIYNKSEQTKQQTKEKQNIINSLKDAQSRLAESLTLYKGKGTWIYKKKNFKPATSWGRVNAVKTRYYYSTDINIKKNTLEDVLFEASFNIDGKKTYYEDGSTDVKGENYRESFSDEINESTTPAIKYGEPEDAPKGYYLSLNGRTPDIDFDYELFFISKNDALKVKKMIEDYVEILNKYKEFNCIE